MIRGLARLIRHHPIVAMIVLLIAGGWYLLETRIAQPAMIYMGLPAQKTEAIRLTRVLRNDHFMVGYSEWLGNPLWVSYQVLPEPAQSRGGPRPGRFQADWRSLRCITVIACVDHEQYSGSGHDRGHLAPNHLIASRHGPRAQGQTFLMTNVSPQRPDLNQGPWRALEALAAGPLAERHAPFWVITGPVFDREPIRHLPGLARIAVPDAFYKIFIREAGNQPVALAFLMPQSARRDADPFAFLTSIREIERQTGLDFFHELPDEIETGLETTITPNAWDLEILIGDGAVTSH